MKLSGKALRKNGKLVRPQPEVDFFPELITQSAEKIIEESDPSKPWYMFFSTVLPHTAFKKFAAVQYEFTGCNLHPLLKNYLKHYDDRRKQLCETFHCSFYPAKISTDGFFPGSIQEMDKTFQRLIDSLQRKNVLNNTIIVFLNDNGAPVPQTSEFTHGTNHGSNWPLRQGKGSLFEGSLRTLAFIWSPLLRKRGYTWHDLFHISDWMPTLYDAAGGNMTDLDESITAVNHWKYIRDGRKPEALRSELPLNVDPLVNQSAIIYRDNETGILFKLLVGNVFDNTFTGW